MARRKRQPLRIVVVPRRQKPIRYRLDFSGRRRLSFAWVFVYAVHCPKVPIVRARRGLADADRCLATPEEYGATNPRRGVRQRGCDDDDSGESDSRACGARGRYAKSIGAARATCALAFRRHCGTARNPGTALVYFFAWFLYS